jgi:hypothetical protein
MNGAARLLYICKPMWKHGDSVNGTRCLELPVAILGSILKAGASYPLWQGNAKERIQKGIYRYKSLLPIFQITDADPLQTTDTPHLKKDIETSFLKHFLTKTGLHLPSGSTGHQKEY